MVAVGEPLLVVGALDDEGFSSGEISGVEQQRERADAVEVAVVAFVAHPGEEFFGVTLRDMVPELLFPRRDGLEELGRDLEGMLEARAEMAAVDADNDMKFSAGGRHFGEEIGEGFAEAMEVGELAPVEHALDVGVQGAAEDRDEADRLFRGAFLGMEAVKGLEPEERELDGVLALVRGGEEAALGRRAVGEGVDEIGSAFGAAERRDVVAAVEVPFEARAVADAEDEIDVGERDMEQRLKRGRVGGQADAEIDVGCDDAGEFAKRRCGGQFGLGIAGEGFLEKLERLVRVRRVTGGVMPRGEGVRGGHKEKLEQETGKGKCREIGMEVRGAPGKLGADSMAGSLNPRSGDWRTVLLPAALIVLAVVWIYSPVIRGDWLWDDKQLIKENATYIHDRAGLWRIWADPHGLPDYYPLLTSVEWLEWHLWHENVAGYHVVTIGLHVLGAFLLWRLLGKLGVRMAWLGALLFAIHPVQVESVAWMAELKNTLSLPPFLLAMMAYIDFDDAGKKSDYARAALWFIVAMLCKTTMVMFPFVILLYAWWKRGHIRRADWAGSSLFLAISIVFGSVTFWFQQHHAFQGEEVAIGGWLSRVALVGTATAFYLFNCVWPVGLLPIYAKWTVDPPSVLEFVIWPGLLAVVFVAWMRRTSWGRHVLLGLGFFLINLVPFVGLTTPYFMTFSWVVDHVLYLPLIGLAGLAAVGVGAAFDSARPFIRCGATVGVVGYCVFLAAVAHGYAGQFVNQATLWTYMLKYNPDAWPAHNNLGNYLCDHGRVEEGIEHYEQAIRLNPRNAQLYESLGNGYVLLERYPEAIAQYQRAISIVPGYVDAHFNLGRAFALSKRYPEAIEQYELVVEMDPGNSLAHLNLGELFT